MKLFIFSVSILKVSRLRLTLKLIPAMLIYFVSIRKRKKKTFSLVLFVKLDYGPNYRRSANKKIRKNSNSVCLR